MTKILCEYNGDGQTRLVHEPTGRVILTDLPPDNGGQGREFSPTDLFAASFAACMLTIMGKMAAARGDDLTGARVETEKIMSASPRRVGEFILDITFPAHFTPQMKQLYKGAVHACPVHESLHPDIKITLNIH